MATTFDELHDLFIMQVDDYELGLIELDDLNKVLDKYVLNGLLTIQEVSPTIFEELNVSERRFNVDLSMQINLLIAKAMKLEWVKEKLYSEELMRKSIGDRDYKAVQGTDYLREIQSLSDKLNNEIRNDLMRIAYLEPNIISGFADG